ncbi:MAG: hypothetical protein KH334_07815, partial [Clostridiales bacterium]|nr:hypothetical protein [Clostridiales bacterium]
MFGIEAMNKLAEWFARLPGIGPKSAARLAYHVIDMEPEDVKAFAQDLYAARLAVRYCTVCGNLTDREKCYICEDERRDTSTICVVRDSRDVMAIERAGNTGAFTMCWAERFRRWMALGRMICA